MHNSIMAGVTPSLRPKMWRVAMGLPQDSSEVEVIHYDRLRQECDEYDVLTDKLFLLDVQNIMDDPRYFPFGDIVKETVLCMSRGGAECAYDVLDTTEHDDGLSSCFEEHENGDSSSCSKSSHSSGTKICSAKERRFRRTVQPFLGFASYVAPLCYLYRDRASIFSMADTLWATTWCKLNVCTGDTGGLLHVCQTFEHLLSSTDPRLFLHLLSLNVQPLRIAFPWLQLCFVTVFEIDQLLILWDRLLGFDDLTLLAVLAAAIFIARSETLMMCTLGENAILMLNECSALKVLPLLQMMLFKEVTFDFH